MHSVYLCLCAGNEQVGCVCVWGGIRASKPKLITGLEGCMWVMSDKCWRSAYVHTLAHTPAGFQLPEVNKQTTIRESHRSQEQRERMGKKKETHDFRIELLITKVKEHLKHIYMLCLLTWKHGGTISLTWYLVFHLIWIVFIWCFTPTEILGFYTVILMFILLYC